MLPYLGPCVLCLPISPRTPISGFSDIPLSLFPFLYLHCLVRAQSPFSTYTLAHVTYSDSDSTPYLETIGLLITAIARHSLSPPLPDNHHVGHDCQEQDRPCLSLSIRAPTIVQPSSPLVYPMSILDITITAPCNHAHQHPRSSPSPTILLPPHHPKTRTLVHGLLP